MTYFHWFHVPKAGSPETLALVGITMREQAQSMTFEHDDESGHLMAQVGSITVYPDGRIIAWANKGIPESARRILWGCAEKAFREKPSKATGWEYRPRNGGKGYWASGVSVPVGHTDPVAMAVHAWIETDAMWTRGGPLQREYAAAGDTTRPLTMLAEPS